MFEVEGPRRRYPAKSPRYVTRLNLIVGDSHSFLLFLPSFRGFFDGVISFPLTMLSRISHLRSVQSPTTTSLSHMQYTLSYRIPQDIDFRFRCCGGPRVKKVHPVPKYRSGGGWGHSLGSTLSNSCPLFPGVHGRSVPNRRLTWSLSDLRPETLKLEGLCVSIQEVGVFLVSDSPLFFPRTLQLVSMHYFPVFAYLLLIYQGPSCG